MIVRNVQDQRYGAENGRAVLGGLFAGRQPTWMDESASDLVVEMMESPLD